jgi:uncharacterized cupredoxin-like copper-binding protein
MVLATTKGVSKMSKLFLLVVAVALIAAGCGAAATSADGDTAAATTTVAPTTSLAPGTTVAPTTTMASHGDADTGSTGDSDRTVEVLMTEFAFDVDPLEVAAGETIEFVVTNAGVVPHEFRLSNTHRIEEHMASGHEGHGGGDDETAESGHHEDGDIVLMLEAGETSSIVATFPEDTTMFTEVACLLPGHYEAGMHSDVAYSA